MFCPNCGMENPDNAAECRRCHVPLQEEAHAEAAPAHGEVNAAGAICSRCETFNEPGIERCTTCGYPLGATPGGHEEPAGGHHEEAHAEHEAAHEAPAAHVDHDEAGSTHMLEPVMTHDTPAEGNPSLSEELSALELSPEDARAARGEDATPPDGSPPIVRTEEHQIELPHEPASFSDEDEDATSVSAEPEFLPPSKHTPPAPTRAPSSPGASRRVPLPAPVAAPPPVPTPAPAIAAEKICASCASANLPNAKFCAECGTPFPKKAAAPAPAAPSPVVVAHEEPVHEEPAHEEPAHEEAAHEEVVHEQAAEPEPLHAESLHEAMHAAAEEHGASEQHGVSEEAREAEHAPHEVEQEPAHEEVHEEPLLEELPQEAIGEAHEEPQSFDPQKTDQSEAAPEDVESTSEQPRVVIADDLQEEPAHGASDADDPGGVAPLAAHEHEEAEAGLSVSVESIQPIEEYAVEGAHGEEHPSAPFEEAQEAAPAEEAEAAVAHEEAAPEEYAAPLEELPAEAEQPAAHEVAAEEPVAEEPIAEEPVAPPYTVLLVVEQGEHAGTSFHLAALENSIGGAGAAIELNEDVHLAPYHATVLFEEQRLLLRDEGTANGVYLKLRESAPLEPGDQFIAGQRLLRFDGAVELPSTAGDLPLQGAPRPAGSAVRVVELLSGGKQGRSCHRSGPVIAVGKSGCDLNFGSDELLAPRHAEIHLAEDGSASLVDLGAVPAGVLLRLRNGATVELQAGDVLQLGGQTVRVDIEQPA